jgi:hypothetical protein
MNRYEVRAIVNHRITSQGGLEFQVQWVGYAARTWEPAANLDDCDEALRLYYHRLGTGMMQP